MNTDKVRILQLIDRFGAGGAQEIMIELLRGWTDPRFEFEVASLFPGDECTAPIVATGVRVHRLQTGLAYRSWAVADPSLTRRLPGLLRQGRFDAVRVHLYAAPLHLTLACAGSLVREDINNIHHIESIYSGTSFPHTGCFAPARLCS